MSTSSLIGKLRAGGATVDMHGVPVEFITISDAAEIIRQHSAAMGDASTRKDEGDGALLDPHPKSVSTSPVDSSEMLDNKLLEIKIGNVIVRPDLADVISALEADGYIVRRPAPTESSVKKTKLSPYALDVALRVYEEAFPEAINVTFDGVTAAIEAYMASLMPVMVSLSSIRHSMPPPYLDYDVIRKVLDAVGMKYE